MNFDHATFLISNIGMNDQKSVIDLDFYFLYN